MKKCLTLALALGVVTGCGSGPTAPVANANIAGSYDATVTASAACSANLPAESRALDFLVEMAQTGTAIQVKLIAKVAGVPEVSFAGSVSGRTVSFPAFSFTAPMGRGAALGASGSADVATNGLSINGTLNGTYQTPAGASCTATNHQLKFTKLCLQPIPGGTAYLPCPQ